MSTLPARNRVIYQSEALFVSPDTTGHHLYYYPPVAAEGKSALVNGDECVVNGVDDSNISIWFDSCRGRRIDSPDGGLSFQDFTLPDGSLDPKYDFKYTTMACTGTKDVDPDNDKLLHGYNPVLYYAGFNAQNTPPNNNGLAYLQYADEQGTALPAASGSIRSVATQLKRVQSANYSFTINRQDVNQFGHLGRLDAVVLEAPTVSLDYSYLVTDGFNERILGFVTDGQHQSLSGLMGRVQNEFGNNYFILTVPEGRDAVLGDQLVEDSDKSVIGLGNSYITDYSLEASVGSFPTASVTVESLNIKSDIGPSFKEIPAVSPKDGSRFCDSCFFLPPAITGQGQSVLKPGDITINLKDSALISKQISGTTQGYQDNEELGSAHIQSFTLSTPMGRTDLQRLGNTYSYAKEIDFPVTATLTINALVSDLKDGNLVNLLCAENKHDLEIKMQLPECLGCNTTNQKPNAIKLNFNQCLLDSESFSSSIGDNKTVDLTFTTQIGGPEEQGVGLFLTAIENYKSDNDQKHKAPPQVKVDYNQISGLPRRRKFYPHGQEGTSDEPEFYPIGREDTTDVNAQNQIVKP